jgi:hypothetical protein
MTPTIGRIVHAVLRDNRGAVIIRPAIITRIWDGSSCVQATIFPDANNDGLGQILSMSSLPCDPAGLLENS